MSAPCRLPVKPDPLTVALNEPQRDDLGNRPLFRPLLGIVSAVAYQRPIVKWAVSHDDPHSPLFFFTAPCLIF